MVEVGKGRGRKKKKVEPARRGRLAAVAESIMAEAVPDPQLVVKKRERKKKMIQDMDDIPPRKKNEA